MIDISKSVSSVVKGLLGTKKSVKRRTKKRRPTKRRRTKRRY